MVKGAVSFALLAREGVLQREPPRAPAVGQRLIRVAADAFAYDAGVDGTGELAVLGHAGALAGVQAYALAQARLLHAAYVDAIHERIAPLVLVAVHGDLVVGKRAVA